MEPYKAGRIDRDPVQILGFAEEICNYCDEQKRLIGFAKKMVDGYLSCFDEKTQGFADTFLKETAFILSDLEKYEENALELKKSAQRLIELQNETHFG